MSNIPPWSEQSSCTNLESTRYFSAHKPTNINTSIDFKYRDYKAIVTDLKNLCRLVNTIINSPPEINVDNGLITDIDTSNIGWGGDLTRNTSIDQSIFDFELTQTTSGFTTALKQTATLESGSNPAIGFTGIGNDKENTFFLSQQGIGGTAYHTPSSNYANFSIYSTGDSSNFSTMVGTSFATLSYTNTGHNSEETSGHFWSILPLGIEDNSLMKLLNNRLEVTINDDANVPNNTFKLDKYDLTISNYLNTRDDSGVTAPFNFLYTDDNGKFLSTSLSNLPSWGLTGNSGLDANVNYIGTNDAAPLYFKVNAERSGCIDDVGNTSFGYNSLKNIDVNASYYNTIIGSYSGNGFTAVTTASYNIGVGTNIFETIEDGSSSNIGIGFGSLYGIDGVENVFIGENQGDNLVKGFENVCIGTYAGRMLDGSRNVFIGARSGMLHTNEADNNIVIGYNQNSKELGGNYQLNIGGAIFGTELGGDVNTPKGNIGIGTPTPFARLDIDGGLIIRPTFIDNFTVNGTIAQMVVDEYSVAVINQTTVGITINIPNPTNAQEGRFLYVVNNGTVPMTIKSVVINVNTYTLFLYINSIWMPISV